MNCTRMIWKKRINLYYSYTPGPWPHLPCREWGYCWPSVEILKIPINKSAKIVFCKNVCIKYTNFRITVLDEWCKTFRVIFPFWLLMKIVDKLPTRYFFFWGGGLVLGLRFELRSQGLSCLWNWRNLFWSSKGNLPSRAPVLVAWTYSASQDCVVVLYLSQ